jgi:GH18 family chitinase
VLDRQTRWKKQAKQSEAGGWHAVAAEVAPMRSQELRGEQAVLRHLITVSHRQAARQTSAMPPPVVNAVYYPSWMVYKGKPPSSMQMQAITHVFYAFVG